MKLVIYIAVFIFIFLETAIAGQFPYYAMALSFLGYMAYSKEIYSVLYTIPIVMLLGVSATNIEQLFIFFIIYVLVLNQVYRHILFDKVNIFVITGLEVALYFAFLYFFRMEEIKGIIVAKESVFILLYNFIFYYFDRAKNERE